MAKKSQNALTDFERKIVKSLLHEGRKNQDIQHLINIGRSHTINSGRITEIKKNTTQVLASDEELKKFFYRKETYDWETGLNLMDDERIIKARDAMLFAVSVFNTPYIKFKSESFSVNANIAWTYLVHEYCLRKKISIYKKKSSETFPLSYLLKEPKLKLSNAIKENLKAIKEIRDKVEHHLTGNSDPKWYAIFQACALNFDKTLVSWFGKKTSIQKDLAFAIQFVKLNLHQIKPIQMFNIPEEIETLDLKLNQNIPDEIANNPEYKLKVHFTLSAGGRSTQAIEFIEPNSVEGKEIHNILTKDHFLPTHEMYPLKASLVVNKVKKHLPWFSITSHTKAWKKFKIRPNPKDKKPDSFDPKYCFYDSVHKDYLYNDEWCRFLTENVKDKNDLT